MKSERPDLATAIKCKAPAVLHACSCVLLPTYPSPCYLLHAACCRQGVGKKSKKAIKKALAATAGEPFSALPPPKGPKAQLMQKLLKLSDVVSAQRAAAAAAKAAQRSGGGAAAVASPAAADRASGGGAADAGLEAGAAAGRSNLAEVGSSALQQSGIAARTSSISGVQQDEQQQQQQAATASEAAASHLNKSSALERLKNTLMRY